MSPVPSVSLIAPVQLAEMIAANRPMRIIHVCGPDEYAAARIHTGSQTAIAVHGPQFWEHIAREDHGGLESFVDEFEGVFADLNISGDEDLVFVEVDHSTGRGHSFRGWLIAIILGYDPAKLFVLDGGMARWRATNRPIDSSPPEALLPAATPKLTLRHDLLADRAEVARVAAGELPGTVILDLRSVNEFADQSSSPDGDRPELAAGRIPGSVNVDWKFAFGRDGTNGPFAVAPDEVLRTALEPLQLDRETPIIVTCYKSARAAVVAAILWKLGYQNVKVYLEGWHGYASAKATVPFEVSAQPPSASRVFGANRDVAAKLVAKAATRGGWAVTADQNPGGYEGVDMAEVKRLAEQHRWLTGPLICAGNHVRHSPFYVWLQQLSTPAEFQTAARNLFHHSVTFPQVMGAMLGGTPLAERRLMRHYAHHCVEEVEHHAWLAEWMFANKFAKSMDELIDFIPTFETTACVDVGWRLVRRRDSELWMVVLNSAIERLSNDLFKVLALRMRELGHGHKYFDVHVGADEFHSILGLRHVKVYDPGSPRGRELIRWGLDGVKSWSDMLHSWIGNNYRVQFDDRGYPVKRTPLKPSGVLWPTIA